jgi:hypothetical protein
MMATALQAVCSLPWFWASFLLQEIEAVQEAFYQLTAQRIGQRHFNTSPTFSQS